MFYTPSDNSETLHYCGSLLVVAWFCWFSSPVPGSLVCTVKFYSGFPILLMELFVGIPGGLGFSFASTGHIGGHYPFRAT